MTVHSQTVVYGDDFDTSVCGFENTPLYGDDKVSVTSYNTAYNAGANAGETFEIGAETAENNNYEFIVVKGVLTVLKADLTATVTGPSAIVYGETPAFDFIVTSGLKGRDEKADVGTMTYSAGPALYSGDMVTLEVFGKQSHGAAAYAGVDAINIAAHIVIALEEIVAREIPMDDSAVVLVGKIEGGDSCNTTAGYAKLEVSARAQTEEKRQFLLKRIE